MPPKLKRRLLSFKERLILYLPLIAGLFLLIAILKTAFFGFSLLKTHGLTTQALTYIITGQPEKVIKSYKKRTNILLLGAAGGDNSGSDLTDTMIFISISLVKKDVFLVSLPRDIWSPTLQDKINSAYHYGEEKKEGGGFVLAKSIAEEVVGQPVHYIVLLDFSGFKNLIDVLGGIEIYVENGFVDERYPIPGKENDSCDGDFEYSCRYETIVFEKGTQKMDGETALKYVRSRNAEGEEGTDFARSRRQQEVILAVKKKILTPKILLRPLKLKEIYDLSSRALITDLSGSELLALGSASRNIKKEDIRRIVLDTGNKENDEKGWLYNPPVSKFGRWVLYPITDSFDAIHELVSCHLNSPDCQLSPNDY